MSDVGALRSDAFPRLQLLAFKFTDWAYTGGAHGNGSIIGVIVDLDKGKLLSA